MKYCDKCNMQVRGGDVKCPLCQTRLRVVDEDGEASVFPHLPTIFRQHKLFFKLLIMITVSAGIICLAINYMLPSPGWWSLYVVFGISCFWICLAIVLRKKENMFKTVVMQVVTSSLLCFLLDLITGWTRWSLNYFFPIACSVGLIALAIVAKVKKQPVEDFLIYFITAGFFGIIPVIFCLTKVVTILIPSVLCVMFSVITFTALLVFEWKTMVAEISRRFHL